MVPYRNDPGVGPEGDRTRPRGGGVSRRVCEEEEVAQILEATGKAKDKIAKDSRFSGMIDAQERVRGEVPYTINVELPGMLEAKLLRSSSPHARIKRLDVSKARRVNGVAAVLTGEELTNREDINPYFGP